MVPSQQLREAQPTSPWQQCSMKKENDGDSEAVSVAAVAAAVPPLRVGSSVAEDAENYALEEKKIDDGSHSHSIPSQQQQHENDAHHVHFSPTKSSWTDPSTTPRKHSFQRSRTTSWTEHDRAPEPFSSPAPKKRVAPVQNKKYGYGTLLRSSSSGVAGKRDAALAGSKPAQKYGYGNFFRSSSSGLNNSSNRDAGSRAETKSSSFQHHHSGRNYSHDKQNYALQRGYSEGSSSRISTRSPALMVKRQPSFSKSDFPMLSPAPTTRPSLDRKESWSNVVSGSERVLTATAAETEVGESAESGSDSYDDFAAVIPPLPLCGDPLPTTEEYSEDVIETSIEGEVDSVEEQEVTRRAVHLSSPLRHSSRTLSDFMPEVDKEVESSEEEMVTTVTTAESSPSGSPIHSSRTYWAQIQQKQQQTKQRQRAHSFHYQYPSAKPINPSHQFSSSTKNESFHHPFSTFTTKSISALQNDIGTLLARSNRVDEAIKRYRLSIDTARGVLDSMQNEKGGVKENRSDSEALTGCKVVSLSSAARASKKKCPKVTEAEGLAWFRQKLLRGDVIPAHLPTKENGATADADSKPSLSSDSMPPPPPFQPAGFGGYAPHSPMRMRSASFSVADLCPAPPKHLAMPLISDEHYKQAPNSPVRLSRPVRFDVRLASCPVTAPHPGKPTLSVFQPHTPQPHLSRAQSFGLEGTSHSVQAHHHQIAHSTAPMDDIVHDIHQHQKLDCPDEVYSCNGLTPLGLEYICDPLPVLGIALRRLVSETDNSLQSRHTQNVHTTKTIELASLIAAQLNMASLEYRLAGGGESDKLSQVLEVLELALQDCLSASQTVDTHQKAERNCKAKSSCVQLSTLFCLLKAIVYSNIGTVKYRLKKVRDSLASFEAAKAALENANDESHLNEFDDFGETRDCNHNIQSEPHDDNRFPPHSYLLLVARLNLSRVWLRLSKTDESSELCKMIAEDAKPHRRNSSRRALLSGPGYRKASFRRSNSFTAASSALETAIAAYNHDIDRRSKWLTSVAEHYISGLIHEANGESSDYKEAWHHYNRLLSTARVKLDHRHPYICALLERRGAVLFEQRKLQCSMLSYLACLKILEHQKSTGNAVFNKADLSRVLYAVARVLHDKEEYHDALHMYQRALTCQRALAAVSGRPSLEVITTLCNISRVHHLSGEIDAALSANREVLELATILVGGKMEHPFLIHRLKVEGNILVEAGRLEDAMRTFVEAARRCSEDGRDRMMTAMMGEGSGRGGNSQEDADAGDSSVLSIRSAAALAQINFIHPSAAAA